MDKRLYQILNIVCLFIICICLFVIANFLNHQKNNKPQNIKVILTCPKNQETPKPSPTNTINSTKLKYFEIGSTENELIEVMGKPTDVLKGYGEKEVWYYGQAKVFLNDGKVTDYDNNDKLLKAKKRENKK